MRTRVAHALWSAETSWTRRTGLSVNPQFTTYQPRNSVQTTGATALCWVCPVKECEKLFKKKRYRREKAKTHNLIPDEISILKTIASTPDRITSPQFAKRLKMNPVRVEYALHLLLEKQFIFNIGVDEDGLVEYVLDNNGNAYLVTNNMV